MDVFPDHELSLSINEVLKICRKRQEIQPSHYSRVAACYEEPWACSELIAWGITLLYNAPHRNLLWCFFQYWLSIFRNSETPWIYYIAEEYSSTLLSILAKYIGIATNSFSKPDRFQFISQKCLIIGVDIYFEIKWNIYHGENVG